MERLPPSTNVPGLAGVDRRDVGADPDAAAARNILPGSSSSLLALGWIYKDGVALLLSLLAGVAALGWCA